jgi:endonuclease YncB( thermonuclease family)
MWRLFFCTFLILVSGVKALPQDKPAAPTESAAAPDRAGPQEVPAEISGKVTEITDGDTIVVWDGKHLVKIRLAGIDAPERKQEFGSKSRQSLVERVARKQIRIETQGKDRFGRTVGTVFLEKENVNLWLVENGWAWHYLEYSDSKTLAEAEEKARVGKLGLWSDANPLAPWDWRTKQAATRAEKKVAKKVASDSPTQDRARGKDSKPNAVKRDSGSPSVSPAPARSSGGTVKVRGYTRKDGTYVRPHTRRAPRRK